MIIDTLFIVIAIIKVDDVHDDYDDDIMMTVLVVEMTLLMMKNNAADNDYDIGD